MTTGIIHVFILESSIETNGLFLLVNTLRFCLLCPLGTDAEETSIGTGHTQAGESLEVLFILRNHPGLLLLVHILDGHDSTRELRGHLDFLLSAVSLLGCGGLPGEEDELGAILFQALYIGLQGLR